MCILINSAFTLCILFKGKTTCKPSPINFSNYPGYIHQIKINIRYELIERWCYSSRLPKGSRFFEVIYFSPRFVSSPPTNLIGYLLKLMADTADWTDLTLSFAFIFYGCFPSSCLSILHTDEAMIKWMGGKLDHIIKKWLSSPSLTKWEKIANDRWPPISKSSLFRLFSFMGSYCPDLGVKSRSPISTQPVFKFLFFTYLFLCPFV